jgi:hypothetical protein
MINYVAPLATPAEETYTANLHDKDVCTAVYPSCFTEQATAGKMMEGIGKAFKALAMGGFYGKTHADAAVLANLEAKVKSFPSNSSKLIGVVNRKPEQAFSSDMLIAVQKDAKSGMQAAQKTNAAFKTIVTKTHDKTLDSQDVINFVHSLDAYVTAKITSS